MNTGPFNNEQYNRNVKVIDLLDSHHFAARGVRGGKWVTLIGSTAMASGVVATAVPEKVPFGGAVLATLAEIYRRGNRGVMNEASHKLSALGIAPPEHPTDAFRDTKNGTLYMGPTKNTPYWTVICAKQETPPASHTR